jgi:hypothetical protein
MKEAWNIIRKNYTLSELVIIIITIFAVMFLPFGYILIGTLVFSYFIVSNINKLRNLKQSDNICEHKYYDLRNPISIIITFLCSFMLLTFNVLYGLLQISLVLMLWARLNVLHSFTEISLSYGEYSSDKIYTHIIQKIFYLVNITVSVIPFSIFPIFWKTTSGYKEDYWISMLTKQMMIAIDRPKVCIMGVGLTISLLFGIFFSFKKRPKQYCTDENYKVELVSMLQKNAFALYSLLPIVVYIYGDRTINDMIIFFRECLDYIKALKDQKENML